MAVVRIILIGVVLLVMGGIGFMQYRAMSGGGSVDAAAALGGAEERAAPARDYAAAKPGAGGGMLIKSTKTISRVGGDKTITITRKPPSLWTRIRMWFGYKPKDAHAADFARLKRQRELEAARSRGVNSATGRRESTASAPSSSSSGGTVKRSLPNKSLAERLSN